MNKPSFTIIIPTYKRPKLLKRAIQSALQQTWKKLIVLVLDNASGDETSEIVREMKNQDSRIQYVCHKENLGMLGQYQYGLDQVETDFFSFLSDDDLLLPSFCETSINGFTQFPDCCFFASSSIIFSKEKGILRVPLDLWPFEGKYEPILGAYEMIGKYPIPTTVTFRKAFLSQISIDTKNPVGWDCDFLLQLACRFPFAISKKVTGIFFSHSGSFTATIPHQSSFDSVTRIIERAPCLEPKNPSLLADQLRKDLFICRIKFLATQGHFHEGYAMAKLLIAQQPRSLKILFFYISLRLLKSFPMLRIFMTVAKKTRRITKTTHFQEHDEIIKQYIP